jgi:hypothetical protein
MLTTVVAGLGGAAGIGTVLAPVLVHLSARRSALQSQIGTLIDSLQEERDAVSTRLENRDATIAALWDYVHRLRYSIVKGYEPPTMPDGLNLAAVRARAAA